MSTISTFLDPVRQADLALDPDWAPYARKAVDMPAATAAYAALHKALKARTPRFAQTYCSQCGRECGPGESGVSSCIEHIRKQRPQRTHPCTPGVSYAEFRSKFMGVDVRIGYQWEETAEIAYLPPGADAVLTEIWIGDADLGQHLIQLTADVLEAELRDHLRNIPQ